MYDLQIFVSFLFSSRGRIIDGLETEFYIDAHPMSDTEDV